MKLNKQVLEFACAADPDAVMLKHLAQAVATAGTAPGAAGRWQPGRPLALLLSGYFGAGNIGSDMRSGEIVRQLRHLLGADGVAFSALAVSPDLDAGSYAGVRPLALDSYTGDELSAAVGQHDGVIACEGSMFKSTFSDVLSALMAGSLGMARAQGKLAIGYGAEVGQLSPTLDAFVRANTGDALIMSRNRSSFDAARGLGLRAMEGADTAWSFHPAPPERAAALLRRHGWDGTRPVLTVCPVNPFWWPVRASPRMALEMHRTGAHRHLWYRSVFFHADSDDACTRYRRYIDAMARATRTLAAERNAFVLVLGMEKVDAAACNDLAELAGTGRAPLIGATLPVRDVVALLRHTDLLVSSRFHALVGAMPASVPSIGVSMDARIDNLLGDAGQAARGVRADAPDLCDRILHAAARLDPDAVAVASRTTVRQALEGMGRMGMAVREEVALAVPEFPLPAIGTGWEAHLPPLPPAVLEILERG